jgi:membrane-bound ClpP family serine protease
MVTLFLVGAALLGAEVFVPGGVLGALGGLAMLAGCALAFANFGAGGGLLAVGAGCALIGLVLAAEFVWLPRTRAGKKLLLTAEVSGAVREAPDASVVGREAVALTALAPGGYVLVDGKRHEAVSQSGFVGEGGRLRVVAADNFRLVVRRP